MVPVLEARALIMKMRKIGRSIRWIARNSGKSPQSIQSIIKNDVARVQHTTFKALQVCFEQNHRGAVGSGSA